MSKKWNARNHTKRNAQAKTKARTRKKAVPPTSAEPPIEAREEQKRVHTTAHLTTRKPLRENPPPIPHTVYHWIYGPGGTCPADLSPFLCIGDSVEASTHPDHELAQGDWVCGFVVMKTSVTMKFAPGVYHTEDLQVPVMGRLFYVDKTFWVYLGECDRGKGIFRRIINPAKILQVTDAAGRVRWQFPERNTAGPSTANERHRFESGKMLLQMYTGESQRTFAARKEFRAYLARLGRHLLAIRRWRRRFHDIIHTTPSHNHKLPKPRRAIRARVA